MRERASSWLLWVRGRGVWAGVFVGLGLAVAGWSLQVHAQGAEPRIWQGIFSEAQAARGRAIFMDSCLRCHGVDLMGTTAPALIGDRFQTTFGQEPIDRLFLKVRDTMPPSTGAVLDDQAKLDVVTYILKSNGYPTASAELKLASEDLATAQILRKGEVSTVQNFTLVQAVGCLARGTDNTWILTQSTDPVATRDDVASASALSAAATKALGRRSFRLLSAAPFKPDTHVGHKLDVRGLVYVDGPSATLTVTSIQMAAQTCS